MMKSLMDMFRRERKPGDLIFAIAFLVFAFALASALPWQAPFVSQTKLVAQPAFWPLIGVGMMVIFGAIHLFSSLSSPRMTGRVRELILWLRSLEFVGWFVGYVFLIPIIGYLPTSVLFVPALCLRLGYRSPAIFGYGVLFAIAVVLVFKTGLGVALPSGQIYNYLPDGIRNFFIVNF